ncbi:Putative CUE domain-containing protein [Rhizopus microsporus]|nr:Putative CUE domain-containing protein [Rhizopus microsporus]
MSEQTKVQDTRGFENTEESVHLTEEAHSGHQQQQAVPVNEQLPENVSTLKEAFPDIDVDIIEAILQTQNGNVESSFEVLLGMSDPNYQPTPPPMPPRPQTNTSAPYTYYEQPQATTLEEQLRLDEEFAKKLAMEDELRARQRRQQQPVRQDQERSEQDSIFNLQEELPIIKEKVKEAGNAAKRKVLDLYNQFKASRNNNSFNSNPSAGGSSIPTTNAHYKGLPSDDGDDLLTGDISALHLSDYDVYTKTNNIIKRQNSEKNNDVIHVHPPAGNMSIHTSTPDEQLRADEDFARQLAEQEELEAIRRRQTSERNEPQPPQMPVRKQGGPTVVIAPKSPLELDEYDYEEVRLNAAPPAKPDEKDAHTTQATNSVPYVIGDDEDSDSDDLVDADNDTEKGNTNKDDTKELAKKVI